jgi:hypothetical protein
MTNAAKPFKYETLQKRNMMSRGLKIAISSMKLVLVLQPFEIALGKAGDASQSCSRR